MIKVYKDGAWHLVSGNGAACFVSETEPTTAKNGDFWTTGENQQLKLKKANGTWMGIGGSASVIEHTHAELVGLRNFGELVPGQLYRITDYVAYTSQANTQSANHPFDIIVLADSKTSINENAIAILHDGDTYFASNDLSAWEIKYSLDSNSTKWTWSAVSEESLTTITSESVTYTRKPTLDLHFDTSSGDRTAYAFATSSGAKRYMESLEPTLAAYCYGNAVYRVNSDYSFNSYDGDSLLVDGIPFTYSGESREVSGVTYYELTSTVMEDRKYYSTKTLTEAKAVIDAGGEVPAHIIYMSLETQYTVDSYESGTSEDFKGVIYYMKDEYNNEAGYDFKGIQIEMQNVASASTSLTTTYNVSPTFVDEYVPYGITLQNYTLGTDTAFYYLFGNATDGSLAGTYIDNNIPLSTTIPMMNIRSSKASVGKNSDYIAILGLRGNIIGEACKNIAIGTDAKNNRIEEGCQNVVMESECYGNAITGGSLYINIGKEAYKNTINNSFNIILGSGCYQNVFTGSCHRDYLTASSDNTFIACNDFTGLVTSHTNFCYNKFSNSDYARINKTSVTTNTEVRNCTRTSSSSIASVSVAFTGTTKYVTIDNCKEVGFGGTTTNSAFINCTTAYVRTEATVSNTTAENSTSVYLGEDGVACTFSKVKVKDCENITLASTTMSESSVTNSSYVVANTGATITNSSIEDCKCESTTPVTINGTMSESKINGCYTVTVTADGALVRSTIKNGNTINIAGTVSQSSISDSDKIGVKKGCTIRVVTIDSSYDIYLGDEDANTVTYYTTHILSSNSIYVKTKNQISRLTISSICYVYINQDATIESLSITDAAPIASDPITINGTARCSNFKGVVKLTLDGSIINSELNSVYNISVTGSLNYCTVRNISGSGTCTIAGTVVKTTMDNCPDCNIASGTTIDSCTFNDMNTLKTYGTCSMVRVNINSCKTVTIGATDYTCSLTTTTIANTTDFTIGGASTLKLCTITDNEGGSIGDTTAGYYTRTIMSNCQGCTLTGTYCWFTMTNCTYSTVKDFGQLYSTTMDGAYRLTVTPENTSTKYEYWHIQPAYYQGSTVLSNTSWRSKMVYRGADGIAQGYMSADAM